MTFPATVHRSNGQFEAALVGAPDVRATAGTREEALAALAVPIVVLEEIIRGRLNTIRQAKAGKGRVTIELAYSLFEQTLNDVGQLTILSFTLPAQQLVKEWRTKKNPGRHSRFAHRG